MTETEPSVELDTIPATAAETVSESATTIPPASGYDEIIESSGILHRDGNDIMRILSSAVDAGLDDE